MKDALGSVQSVLVLGGGSDIARATLRELVQRRARTVVLAARDPESLSATAEELLAAGATRVETVAFDARDTASHDGFVADVGGRIYLAKDSRLRPELLPAMYPDLDRFAELRARVDPAGVLQSDLQRRLGLP